MAKREKLEAPKVVSKDDLKRVVREIRKQKESAAEYVGLAGQATKNAVDRYGLNRKALSFAVGLDKLDDAKRQDTLRSVILYASHLGFFDQMDAFSDIIPLLQDVLNRAHNVAPAAGGEDDEEDDEDGLDEELVA